jgi:hypothetical protein
MARSLGFQRYVSLSFERMAVGPELTKGSGSTHKMLVLITDCAQAVPEQKHEMEFSEHMDMGGSVAAPSADAGKGVKEGESMRASDFGGKGMLHDRCPSLQRLLVQKVRTIVRHTGQPGHLS